MGLWVHACFYQSFYLRSLLCRLMCMVCIHMYVYYVPTSISYYKPTYMTYTYTNTEHTHTHSSHTHIHTHTRARVHTRTHQSHTRTHQSQHARHARTHAHYNSFKGFHQCVCHTCLCACIVVYMCGYYAYFDRKCFD